MTLTKFKEAGYQIQVNYDKTQFRQADVPVEQLSNVDDVSDLNYENDDILGTSYNFDSEEFSIYDKNGNCVADSICTVDGLKAAINDLTKPEAS